MGCRNNYLIGSIIIIILWCILTKPIQELESKKPVLFSFMSNDDKHDVSKDKYSLGDIPLVLNRDTSDINYYRIRNIDGVLNIPDSSVWLNNNYKCTVAPVSKNKFFDRDSSSDLICGEYYSDYVSSRKHVDNYYPSTKFAVEKELYFD